VSWRRLCFMPLLPDSGGDGVLVTDQGDVGAPEDR
jgi:hypothetical protein